MQNYAIEINDLGKMYKLYRNPRDKILDAFNLSFLKRNNCEEFWALRGMELKVKKGERVGLIGNNGAGKSTLLKMIIGNIKPTEGDIKVNGEIQALMELGTGFHPEFTGRQNIRASLAYRGLAAKEIGKLEEEIIEFSELYEFIDQPVRTYSAGMYARLAFSTATSISPDILIVDEVLGAGDAYFSGKCVERMKKITEEVGATVLFVSHDLNSVLRLCDRIVWIERGKIRMQGNPLDVVREYSASVREREEMRLKAREKRKNGNLDIIEDEPILFRIISEDEDSPKRKNKIYKILVIKEKREVAIIDIGEPMDNGKEQDSYIETDTEFMNWGRPEKDINGTYRYSMDLGGKYKHAPFIFKKSSLENLDEYRIKLVADIEEPLKLQVYQNGKYQDIGILSPKGYYAYEFNLSSFNKENEKISDAGMLSNNNMQTEEDSQFKYLYGKGGIDIISVAMLDSKGKERKVFETETSISVEIEYFAHSKISTAVFVFCIYTTDGICASQWIAEPKMYNNKIIEGKGKFVFKISKLLLGKGSYTVSVGIFNGLSSFGVESESFAVIDRSIFFEIEQPLTDIIDKGMCIQPFESELIMY